MQGEKLRLSKDIIVTPVGEPRSKEWMRQATTLAEQMLDECRKDLMLALRFMNTALWHMPLRPEEFNYTTATNGRVLCYDVEHVLARYTDSPHELTRDLIHSVLHCVFRHPYDATHFDRSAWFLACDISMELTIIELCGQRFPSLLDEDRQAAGERLKEMAGSLTPKALYALLGQEIAGVASRAERGITDEDYQYLSEIFCRDSHEMWIHEQQEQGREGTSANTTPLPDANRAEKSEGETDEERQEEGGKSRSDFETASDGDLSEAAGDQESGDGDASNEDDPAEKEWEEIARRMQVEVETFSQAQGGDPGSLMAALAIANRRPTDYTSFLKQFATMGEDMVSNDDEFDYIFYTYGLKRYGNMPLVEPLEYKEERRVREFVIALDTSESCSGELIRAFVTRTYEVLNQQGSLGAEINVHIVQCDSRIQSDTKITSVRELDQFQDEFWIRGYGSTDFRPVFDYVDSLMAMGEFDDLKGLIYFTDGLGTFPAKAPDYETAFVFVSENGTMGARVPPWAMRVTLTDDEITCVENKRKRGTR